MDLPFTYSGDSVHYNWEHKHCSAEGLLLKSSSVYSETEANEESGKEFKTGWADPPVEIHEKRTTNIDLPLLSWHGYDVLPKILSVCNTGRTIAINGQWSTGRPYVEGGPLNGKYIFSQIHFHCPSEHEIDGKRYPLEMHVVHFKTSYLTQERAMREKDGTLVLVYLFQAVGTPETILSRVTELGSCLERLNTRLEVTQFRLCELVKPFFSNYYVYWGSVKMKKTAYVLQWLINCNQCSVTKDELFVLFNVMSNCRATSTKRPKMKPLNSLIYRVGECYDDVPEKKTENAEIQIRFGDTQETAPCIYGSPCKCAYQYPIATNQEPTQYPPESTKTTTLIQPQGILQSPYQNVCSTCGGLEVEAPKFICICREKQRKVCSSCGGSKSGISWCKEKWKECRSKCSLWSKTSSCSEADSICDKRKKRKKPSKDSCRRYTSGSSCSRKYSHRKKSCEKACKSKIKINKCRSVDKCSKPDKDAKETCSKSTLDESCTVPCETNSSTSPCTVTCSIECSSAPEVSEKEKTKKQPKTIVKRKSVTTVKKKEKKKENIQDEKTDCEEEKSEKAKKKKEKKTPAVKKCGSSKDCDKKRKTSKKVKSKESVETSEKGSGKECKTKVQKSENEECNEVTTLFVKMPKSIFQEDNNFSGSDECLDERKDNDDISVKYLRKSENGDDDKSENEVEEDIVETNTSPELKMPLKKQDFQTKTLCFQMMHCFSAEKRNSSQEYQVSIFYDSCVLQEYKGIFQPQEMSLGSSEKVELVPKYQEADEFSIHLEECVIKKQSYDKLCIDSKFSLKSWDDKKNVFSNVKKESVENFNHNISEYSDSKQESTTEKVIPVSVECRSVQTEELIFFKEDKSKQSLSKISSVKSQTVQTEPQHCMCKKEKLKDLLRTSKTKVMRTASEPELSTSVSKFQRKRNTFESKFWKAEHLFRNKRSTEKLECKIKLLRNFQNQLENSGGSSSSSPILEGQRDVNVSNGNTVYFMYDRIEKDSLTGKKIFMGRFRTKEDLRILREHKITAITDSLRSFGSQTTTDKSISVESDLSKLDKSNSLLDTKDLSVELQNIPPTIKEEVSDHKFEPRCLNQTQFKAQNSSLVIADVVKWFQDDGENFEVLADIIGIDKNRALKVPEQQSMRESVSESFSAAKETPNGSLVSASLASRDKGTAHSAYALVPKYTKTPENVISIKTSDSQRIVFVPVEVKSWSKIDVVFIERSDSNQEINSSKKYIHFN